MTMSPLATISITDELREIEGLRDWEIERLRDWVINSKRIDEQAMRERWSLPTKIYLTWMRQGILMLLTRFDNPTPMIITMCRVHHSSMLVASIWSRRAQAVYRKQYLIAIGSSNLDGLIRVTGWNRLIGDSHASGLTDFDGFDWRSVTILELFKTPLVMGVVTFKLLFI